MHILALDVGLQRTGVAYADDAMGVPLSLPTIHHNGLYALLPPVRDLLREKDIQHVVLGLPRLPSGDEGEQCRLVRQFAEQLDGLVLYSFVDERYTSFRSGGDSDASAAAQILLTYLEKAGAQRGQKGHMGQK